MIKGVTSPLEKATVIARAASELLSIDLANIEDEQYVAELILTLGYAPDKEYALLIEPFLTGPYSLPADAALSVLCNFYELTGRYIRQISDLMQGLAWDPYYEVRHIAICVAGSYLKDHKDFDLLRELVMLAEGPAEQDPAKIDPRLSAYHALYEAMGYRSNYSARPLSSRETVSEAEVLDAARERLNREEAEPA